MYLVEVEKTFASEGFCSRFVRGGKDLRRSWGYTEHRQVMCYEMYFEKGMATTSTAFQSRQIYTEHLHKYKFTHLYTV